MGRRGNPYDNAKAESFMKTLKVEEVYLMEYDIFEDVAASLPMHRSIMLLEELWCADGRADLLDAHRPEG